MENLSFGIERAISYIESNISEDIEIGDVAYMAYLSPYYFQRVFHSICGLTVGEYTRRLTRTASMPSSAMWREKSPTSPLPWFIGAVSIRTPSPRISRRLPRS